MNKTKPIIVTLPLPSQDLHAHAKGDWRTKVKATRTARKMAELSSARLRPTTPIETASLSMRFYWPDDRRRDTLNVVHGCKPYVDGLVDAGIMVDDCWQNMSIGAITSTIDRANPRVEITISDASRSIEV